MTSTNTRKASLVIVGIALLAACEGAIGTLQIGIVTAPGADPLANVTRVRLTLDQPATFVESTRGSDGSFVLEMEVGAGGAGGFFTFEGFAANDEVVAYGTTAVLPIAAIETAISIYVAAPDSIAEAPVALDPPRSEIGAALMPFGNVWAGGRDADGEPLANMTIYNVYFHELQLGDPLPEPRAGITAVAGLSSFVYLLGGEDSDGAVRATFWRFDTGVAPAGLYIEFDSDASLARAGRDAVIVGNEQFLVVGDPAAILNGVFGVAAEAPDAPPLDGVAENLVLSDISSETFIAGAATGTAGAVLFYNGDFIDLENAPEQILRTGHTVVELADGDALVLGGGDAVSPIASAVRYRRAERSFLVLDDFLATPRRDAAVAVSGGRIVVAGGTNAAGEIVDDAEIFDAATLERLSVQPLVVPRTGASAGALANGQVVIAGGIGEDGAPVGTIELYTR